MGLIIPLMKPVIGAGGTALKTGLISCWEFDETSGTTAYDSHGSNDLTHNGVTVNQTGKLDKCISLDGTNDYSEFSEASNNLTPISNHSISAWINRNGNSVNDGSGVIMAKYWSSTGYRCYSFYLYDSDEPSYPNRLGFTYYDNSNVSTSIVYDPPSDIFTGNWVNVIITRSESNMTLYVNGSSVATASGGSGNMQQRASTVRDVIGALSKSSTIPDKFINSKIDQIAVWSKALTTTEISALYNSGNGLAYTNW